MDDKQLIAKIKELRQIKPSQDWVIWNKRVLFGDFQQEFQRDPASLILFEDIKKGFNFVFRYKLAFATVSIFCLIIGAFGLSQNALPGDLLYPVRKIAERISAKGDQAEMVFEVANRRSDDLTRVLQANAVKNLGPAISEYKASVSGVAQQIAKKDVKLEKKFVLEIKKLEEKKEKIEALGVKIDEDNELDNAMNELVAREIKELENRSLNEEQKEKMDQIQADYTAGQYSDALEKILLFNAN